MKKWIVLFLALLQILLLVGCVGTQGGNALYADMPTAPPDQCAAAPSTALEMSGRQV